MSTHRRPMLSSDAAVVRRFEALFKAMSTDFLLREQFVTDPAQILSEYLYGAKLAPEKASVNNQLLYSVMSNRGLLRWVRHYVRKHRRHPPAASELTRDFARAVVEHGADRVVLAHIRSSAEQQPLASISGIFFVIFHAGIFLNVDDEAQTFDTTDSATNLESTDISPTTISTDISPTTISTDISPTTISTDISPTTISTDISPTTISTDISPTTISTDISPTNSVLGGSFWGSYFWSVVCEALVEYSTRLADTGVLDFTGIEAEI